MQVVKKIPSWIEYIFIIVLAITLSGCGAEKTDKQLVSAAKHYLADKKIRAAALELKNALKQNPENAEARYLLGNIDLNVGDFLSAEKEFRRAIQSGWAEDQARIGLAKAFIYAHKFQQALDSLPPGGTYTKTAQANIDALKAYAHAGLGDYKQAHRLLASAQHIDANALQVSIIQIQLQLVAGQYNQVGKTVRLALTVHPDSVELLLLQASAAIKNHQPVVAQQALKQVIADDPENWVTQYGRRARLGLAQIEIESRQYTQAGALLAPLFRQNANDPELNYLGGLLAFEQNNPELAEQRLLKVLKVAPNHLQTQLLLGMVNFSRKNFEQAAYYIEKYVSEVPDNIGARKLLGRTYMKLGQAQEAAKVLQAGLKTGSNDAELLALVGVSQLREGNLEAGIAGLQRAVKISPDNAGLRSELARAYISAGRTKNAIRELQSLIQAGKFKEQSELLLVITHLRARQFAEAIDSALSMLNRHADDPAYLTLTGNVFAASNDKAEATKYFRRALAIDHNFVPAIMSLAQLAEQEGDTKKATALYKSVIQLNSKHTGKSAVAPLLALARLAEKSGNTGGMLKWLEQARANTRQDVRPRIALAAYYLRLRQPEKAAVYLQEGLKAEPNNLTLSSMQARVFFEQGQYDNALPLLQKQVARVPQSIYLRTLLAENYLKLGQNDNARKQLGIVLKKQPYYIPALALLVSVDVKAGHQAQALKNVKKIQNVKPENYFGYELAGDIWMAAKQYRKAEDSYQLALKYHAGEKCLLKLAEVFIHQEKSNSAQKLLISGMKKYPDSLPVLKLLGSSYLKNGDNSSAISIFEKLLKKQHNNIVALNNLAWLFSLSADAESVKKAMSYAEKAYKLNPEDPGVQDTYGWLLVQTGQADKGLSILRQVIKVMPAVPEVEYHYAVALIKTGDKNKGKQLLRHLLKNEKVFEGRTSAGKLLQQ